MAQVLAFILQAISNLIPSRLWHKIVARFNTGKVEFLVVFISTVNSQRKNLKQLSIYKPNLNKVIREFSYLSYAIRSKSLPIHLEIANIKDKNGEVVTSGIAKTRWQKCKSRNFKYIHSNNKNNNKNNDKNNDKDNDNNNARNSSHISLPSHPKRLSKTQTYRNARDNDEKEVVENFDNTKK